MNWICLNGEMLPADSPCIMHDDKSFRYGDGMFETMKFMKGKILLADLHFDRLFSSLKLLLYDFPEGFSRQYLEEMIVETVKKNLLDEAARIRLTISRGNGHIRSRESKMNFLIEATELSRNSNELNEKGISIDVFEDGRKSMDRFSNVKSSSALLYSLAAVQAEQNNLDDCLVLNTQNRVADSTIANIFLVRKNLIITPSLKEAGVDGVMRRFLLMHLPEISPGIEVREGVVTKSDLDVFDEVFLTNSIQGIKWVGKYRNKTYDNTFVRKAHNFLVSALYS